MDTTVYDKSGEFLWEVQVLDEGEEYVREPRPYQKRTRAPIWASRSTFVEVKDTLPPDAVRRLFNMRRKLVVYRMSIPTYLQMLKSQEDKCAICQRSGVYLVVDHDHACCASNKKTCGNCVRGLLCYPCNTALGSLRDSVETLDRAKAYLQSPPSGYIPVGSPEK